MKITRFGYLHLPRSPYKAQRRGHTPALKAVILQVSLYHELDNGCADLGPSYRSTGTYNNELISTFDGMLRI